MFRPLNIKISIPHFRNIDFLFAIQIVSRLTVPNFSLICPQKKEKWYILSTHEVNQDVIKYYEHYMMKGDIRWTLVFPEFKAEDFSRESLFYHIP